MGVRPRTQQKELESNLNETQNRLLQCGFCRRN